MQQTVVITTSFVLAGSAGCSGGNLLTSPLTSAPNAYAYASLVDNGGKIYAVPAGGSTSVPTVLAAAAPTDEKVGVAFGFDGVTAYYSDEIYSPTGAALPVTSLLSVPGTGGTANTLVTGLDGIEALAVDAQNVYFVGIVDTTTSTTIPVPYFFGKVPLADGAFETLVPNPSAEPLALAAASGFLYWTDADGNVNRIATTGGNVEPLATNQHRPFYIAADPSGVHLTNLGEFADGETAVDCGSIGGSVAALKTNAPAPITLTSGLNNLSSIAVLAGDVYFALEGPIDCTSYTLTNGQVLRVVPGAPDVEALASGLEQPANVFVDGEACLLHDQSRL